MSKIRSMQIVINVTDIKPLPSGWDSGLTQTGIVAETTSTQPLRKIEVTADSGITITTKGM